MIAKDVRRFLKRFETTLTVLAREGRHVELEARFEDYQKLLNAWLEVAPPSASPPERLPFLFNVDKFSGPFELDIYQVAQAATLSGDSSTVVVLADQFMKGAFACQRRDQPRLMEEFLNTLVFLYNRCLERDGLANAVSHRLDSGLYSLFLTMHAIQREADETKLTSASELTALDVTLRFGLALIHAAVRYEQAQHARYFVDRIFEHRKYGSRHERRDSATTYPAIIFDYVAVVLAGWTLHIRQSDVLKNADAARSVFDFSLSQVPAIPVLIAEWELLRHSDPHDPPIDNRLGVARWDVRDWHREPRVGILHMREGGPDWVKLGLRAALLSSQTSYSGDAKHLLGEQPRRFIWDTAQEREALEALAADCWLGIPEDERHSRVERIMEIIGRRARDADARYLQYVLETPISEDRVALLRNDAERAFGNSRSWQHALRQAGLSDKPAVVIPLSTRFGISVPREYLLDDNNWAPGFGDFLGERTVTRVAVSLIYLIEKKLAQRLVDLKAFATLPESVREARRELMEAGFSPNVLILPPGDQFAGALFQKPLWQVEGRNEFGEASVGVWEGLLVLKFPYSDPESILLLDTRSLITGCAGTEGHPPTRVWIDAEPRNENAKASEEDARAALKSADSPIPEAHVIQVLAWMEALPNLGIVEPKAAVAIDIRNSDGGYAIVEDSNLYHRPSCPDILTEDAQYLLRLRPGDDRNPCPTCRPDRGGAEGRSGKASDRKNEDAAGRDQPPHQ